MDYLNKRDTERSGNELMITRFGRDSCEKTRILNRIKSTGNYDTRMFPNWSRKQGGRLYRRWHFAMPPCPGGHQISWNYFGKVEVNFQIDLIHLCEKDITIIILIKIKIQRFRLLSGSPTCINSFCISFGCIACTTTTFCTTMIKTRKKRDKQDPIPLLYIDFINSRLLEWHCSVCKLRNLIRFIWF